MTARMLAWKQPFIQRVRNSSLVERAGVDKNRVDDRYRRRGIAIIKVSVGEHSYCLEGAWTMCAGALGKANVGISNDKRGEIPLRRKTKVSRAMSFSPGLVGS